MNGESFLGETDRFTNHRHGLRVKKAVTSGTTTVYIFSGSKVIAEYDNGAAVTSPSREYIYSGGTLLAKIESSATVYHHADGLSNRIMTNSSGTVVTQQGHYPYGELWYQTGTGTKWTFTTYERDAESTNDYAMARYYRNALGRFDSPDPLSGSTSDPQSLDRYSYTENDPVDFMDTSGMARGVVATCDTEDDNGDCGDGGYGIAAMPGFWDMLQAGWVPDFSTALPSGPWNNGSETPSLAPDAAFNARMTNDFPAVAETMGWDSYSAPGSLDMIAGLTSPGGPGGGGGGTTAGMYLKVTKDCFDTQGGLRNIMYQLENAAGAPSSYTVLEQLSDTKNFTDAPEAGTSGYWDNLSPPPWAPTGWATSGVQYFLVYPTAQGLNSAQWVPIVPMSGAPIKFNTITMTKGATPAQNVITVNGKVAPPC